MTVFSYLSCHCLSAKMVPRVEDVMRLCCELSAQEQIKVAVKNATRGAMVAGGTALVCGMLAGPPGIAVGENKYLDINFYFKPLYFNISQLPGQRVRMQPTDSL